MAIPGTNPELIAGRYRVLRELGRGGMGVVFVVEHVNTGDHLALKLLLAHANATPATVERFKREARAPAKIKSEHVVRVTDADVAPELDHAPFLVMELLDGQDLEKLVETQGSVPPTAVVDMLAQVARALDKAHAAGIVHRDLKPENLFLHRREDGSQIVKILDFGISKVMGGEGLGSTAQSGGATKTGSVFGTPLYMAPEQARGMHASVGAGTDIWAIGLIAYRLLTGQVYWRANTIAELLVAIIAEPMAPPSTLPPFQLSPAFDPWFARSCERDPALRFQSVGEQVRALAEALGVPVPAGLSGMHAGERPTQTPTLPTAPVVVPPAAVYSQQVAPAESFNQSNASVYSTVPGRDAIPKRSLVPVIGVVGGLGLLAAIVGTVFVMARSTAPTPEAGASTGESSVPAALSATELPPTAPVSSPIAAASTPAVVPELVATPPNAKRETTTKAAGSARDAGSPAAHATQPATPPAAATPSKPSAKQPANYNPEAP